MFMRILRFPQPALLVLAMLAFAVPAGAAETPKIDRAGNELQLFIENDMFSGTDRYYTNGVKLGFGAPEGAIKQLLKVPAEAALRIFPGGGEVHFGLFGGQNMYTPRDIKVREPQPFDRPWAAWLYLGGVAQRVQQNKLDTVEIDVGMVGPAALGEPFQTHWHQLIGSPQPQGWGNQIPNEPAFLVSYLQKRKYGASSGIEFIPHAGATLGTVMTLARAGGIVRAGRNMTGFGPDTIEPGGAMLQNTHREDEGAGRADFEWYSFAGADFRMVGYNIFLDGTLFSSSPSVDRRTAVHDLTAGLSLRYKSLRVSLTRILRSEEFTTPVGGGGKQGFYSLNVGLEF